MIALILATVAAAAAPPTSEAATRPAGPFACVTWEVDGPLVLPWKTFTPDPAYHGQWLVAGDLDGDGAAEMVTARNDRQRVRTAVALRLDGSVLWRWGRPNAGSPGLGYDVPLQLYDLDGNGEPEVYLSIEGYLLVLDGRDGREIRRWPLPEGLQVADCIAFANLRGLDRPRDIIIKDRYTHIWAFTDEFKPLWDWKPRDYKTAHFPVVFDIDGDGRDEVMGGYTLLDDNGRELWTISAREIDLSRGHLDCCEVLRSGGKPEDYRLVLTCCGARGMAMIDGLGRTLWEVTGQHFESVDIGRICPEVPGPQIVVDLAHQPFRQAPVWLMDERGRQLGSLLCGDSRHHRLIDWDGDGFDEILIGHTQRLFDGKGQCVARFGPKDFFQGQDGPPAEGEDSAPFAMIGDLDGDQRPEIILHSVTKIAIYRGDRATKTPGRKPGTGSNFTLY